MPSTRDPAFVTTFSRMRILITGASGTIGAKLVPALEPEHELILLSRRAHADPRCRQVDVCEIDQVIAATGGPMPSSIWPSPRVMRVTMRATTSTANASMPT
jgi:nucleoside-diphosphate-sugar epimerase